MSKILKRPMFRKGGTVEEGIIKLATGGRAMYQSGTTLDPNDPVLQKAMRNKAILEQMTGGTRDTKQDVYDLLISGGLNLVGGVGAGDGTLASVARSFKEPTERFLAKRPGEEAFQRQLGLAAGQAAISEESKKTKQDRLLYLSDLKSQIEQKKSSGGTLTPAEKNRLEAINIEIFKLNRQPYLKGASPASVAQKILDTGGYTVVEANNIANFRDKFFSGKLNPEIVQSLDPNMTEVSSKQIEVTPQGATFSKNITEKDKNKFQPGKSYFNISNGQFYLYKGNSKFQALQ